MLCNYHVTQQILYETSLINKMKESPKLQHQYMYKEQKGWGTVSGSPEAGQWCIDC